MTIRNRIKELRQVKASELLADERNYRRHPNAQRDALQAMLSSIGYADAVIARETPQGLKLIDGHLRAELDPNQVVPVLVTDLDEAEAGKLLLTLDPLAAMAEQDKKALGELAKWAAETDVLMQDLLQPIHGLDVDALLGLPSGLDNDPDVVVEPPAEPVTKRGDVWRLGKCRLMCGDSTDADDVARLLDGAKPRLMVTDPPYGVNYDATWRNKRLVAYNRREGKVRNDDTVNWGRCFIPCVEVVYAWSPPGDHAIDFGREIQSQGINIRAQLIWRKSQLVLGRGNYHFQHELCWYGVRNGTTSGWIGGRKQTTIWDIPNLNHRIDDSSNPDDWSNHSTQKPIECMERPIRNHKGDVYEPFCGSGTTIIAAERQKRVCYAMEIEPSYVDAAVKRWENYAGQKAQLVIQSAG